MSEKLLTEIWRCDVTGNPYGTDTRMIGGPPCLCQGCRAAATIERLTAEVAGARAKAIEDAILAVERAAPADNGEWSVHRTWARGSLPELKRMLSAARKKEAK